MPNITPESSREPSRPERPKGQFISEAEMDLLKQLWMKSIAMIMTKKGIKKELYETKDVKNSNAKEIITSSSSQNESDKEGLQKYLELRDLYNKSPHRKNVTSSVAMYFDDGDKVIKIHLFNEETTGAVRSSSTESDLLDIEFIYKTPVDIVDRAKTIKYATLTTASSESISIVMENRLRDTTSQNAKIITDTLLRLANDPFLENKSISELEAIRAKEGK
jgi:hypothetical protein